MTMKLIEISIPAGPDTWTVRSVSPRAATLVRRVDARYPARFWRKRRDAAIRAITAVEEHEHFLFARNLALAAGNGKRAAYWQRKADAAFDRYAQL